MALGNNINYTPFEETSFGYGVGEIAAAHSADFPNATDIVKVTLTLNAIQPNYWDPATGHISTPSVGTAISAYNKQLNEWSVRGQRDDVDAVLAELLFFPSDYAPVRTWTPTSSLPNITSGAYPMDEPSYQFPMDQTSWFLSLFDASNVYVAGYNVVFYPIDPVYNNQRPYWHTEPTSEDLSSTAYDNQVGGPVDFGIISHGLDTENVTVSAEIRDMLDNLSNAYGAVTPSDDMYVNDKIPASYNHQTGFTFTGSIEETQTFLDTIRYNRIANTNKFAFQFVMSLDDGVIKSYLRKYVYFSDKQPIVTTFPNQATTEETPLYIDITGFSLTNPQQFPTTEVDEWRAILTFDATGQSGIQYTSEPMTNGVITITNNSFAEIVNDLSFLQIDFNPDFKDEFTFTLDIEAEASSLFNNHIWSADQQTINVTIADVPEYYIPPLSSRPNISWNEDTFVNFDTELVITDQAYGGAATYQYEGIAYWYDGSGWQPLTTADWRTTFSGVNQSGSGTSTDPLLITGSRSQVNDALANMQMIPDLDWTTSPSVPTSGCFALHHKITRLQDQSVIAQEGVLGDETGEERDVRTEFNAGTAVDSVVIPSTLDFYGNELVYDPATNKHPTISYINDVVLGVTEETADYHGVTYSCFLYTHANPDIMLDGVIQPSDYVEDGYTDDSYTANQVSFINKTYSELNDILNKLQITKWSSDVYMGFFITRSDDPATGIFDQNIHFVNIIFELSTTLNTSLMNNGNFYLNPAPREDLSQTSILSDPPAQDYVYYNYSGTKSINYAGFRIGLYKTSQKMVGALYDVNEYPIFPSLPGQGISQNSLYSEQSYTISVDSPNDRINVELTYSPQDNVDEYARWATEDLIISAGPDQIVYCPIKCERLVNTREDNPFTLPESVERAAFYPRTLDSTNLTDFVEYRDASKGVFDHMFGAKAFDDNGTKKIKFYDLDVSPSSQSSQYPTAAENNTLEFSTGWAEDAEVVDVFFQSNGLRVYALITNRTYGYWKLISVDTLNSYQLDTSSSLTVHIQSNDELYAGCIGSLESSEAFIAVMPAPIYDPQINDSRFHIHFYHENQGGLINWGFSQDYTTLVLDSYTSKFTKTALSYESKNMWANTKGNIMIGGVVWKFTNPYGWYEVINHGYAHGYTSGDHSAITPDFYYRGFYEGDHLYRLSDNTIIGRLWEHNQPNVSASTIIRGSKRSNVFQTDNAIFRLTK